MDHHQRAERLGLGPERRERRIGQFLAVHIGEDLAALEAELLHRALQFGRGLVAVLQRHGAERDEAVRLARHIGRDAVIEHARRLDGDLDRHGEIALRRRRHHELHVEAHLVHVLQPLVEAVVEPADAAAAVGLLLGVERLDVVGREMRQRHLAEIDMRPGDRRRGRHGHVRMDVDGGRLRPGLAAGLALLARGGRAVAVGVGHSLCAPLHRRGGRRCALSP